MNRVAASLSFILALCIIVASASAEGDKKEKEPKTTSGIEGVKGTVFLIDGKKHKDSKLVVQAHDVVVIEWTYPIAPPFPKSASQKSSDTEVVKTVGIQRVIQVKGPVGVGRLGASFIAAKKGISTLTVEINNGKDDITLTCEVEVK